MKIATFNIQYGAGGIERVAEAVRALDADLLFCQEVDRKAARSGKVDQFEVIAQAGGFSYQYYARTIRMKPWPCGKFGNAAFVRVPDEIDGQTPYPVFRTIDLSIPGDRERRVAIEVNLGKQAPVCFGTHLSVTRINAIEQLKHLLRHASQCARFEDGSPRPWLVCGDLNLTAYEVDAILSDTPDGVPLGYLADDIEALEFTHPSSKPTRRIDHFITSNEPVSSVTFGDAETSDHLGLLAAL